MSKAKALAFVLLLYLLSATADATNYKTLSSVDGLSNNAVLCLHQNNLGHIYIGTADGLNIWDGNSMETFQASDKYNYFFGNMVRHFFPLSDNILYAQTNYGVARLDTSTNDIDFYSELAFFPRLAFNDSRLIFVMDRNNVLHTFDTETRKISQIENNFIPESEACRRMIFSNDGRLCIFTDHDIYVVSLATASDGKTSIKEIKNLNTRCQFTSPSYNDKDYYLIDPTGGLYLFDSDACCLTEVSKIRNLPEGNISGIVPYDYGFYISFWGKGLYYLPCGQDMLKKTDIDCGIFSIIPDKKQPILWIGTDGNGLIKYSQEHKHVSCLTFPQLPHSIKMPVRSIFIDKERTLWFGTKGDGLLSIPDFGDGTDIRTDKCQIFNTKNSSLNHNSVYAIIESRQGFLWIGTEGRGLNCWSSRSRKIDNVRGSERISMVHSIIEQNDSTLWVSTDKNGAYKCRFTIRNGIPVITSVENLKFSEPFKNISIFSMKMQDDSTIWFGSRGKGVLKYNIKTGTSNIIQFPTVNGLAINETFYIEKSDKMLFATGNGLVTYSPSDGSTHQSEHIPMKATHGIICDKDRNIWVSTNSGIISLDSTYNYRLSIDRFSGVEIIEYSDGACHYDEISDKVIFGGINGITIIGSKNKNEKGIAPYTPDINITNFIQNNTTSYINTKIRNGSLTLPYSKSVFGVEFSIVDHLHYPDYEFLYNIEGHNTAWVKNSSDVIYLPSLDPGRYKLKIIYVNKATQYTSEECILPIHILPPFYRSWWAYCIYVLLVGLTIYLIYRYYRQKYISIQEKMHKKYSAEITKITSNTTNSINEELSVQLTFIIGLCQQIRQAATNNPHIADKVNLVEYNIAKINKTLHIFNEYKGITESLIGSGATTLIQVSQTVSEILDIMKSSTKVRNVTLTYNIEEGIMMALNKEAFLTMMYSLIYKVLSTTKGQKTVDIKSGKDNMDNLSIKIALSSDKTTYQQMYSPLSQGELSYTDDKYDIVFCKKLISLMKGKMMTSFDETSDTICIEVILPSLKAVSENDIEEQSSSMQESINMYNTIIDNQLPKNFKSDAQLDYIYIISNNRDISSFLGYFLSDGYNIKSFSDNASAFERIEQKIPIAIIYDVSSMPNCFTDLLERIRGNRILEQIIMIALTSSLQMTEREEFTKLGVDLSISFPFNMNYLRSAIEKLLQKQRNVAEYYKSTMSTYTISEGKVIHQEDKEFINKVFQVIEQHISDPNLSASTLASILGTSTRVLYRKLENITDRKLHQIIRDMRMNTAVSLLASSRHTIDEIMYKVGFDNRSTFYRNFKDMYGKTPKEYRNEIHNDTIRNFTGV